MCRRARMASDAYLYSPDEDCDKDLDKWCFIAGHFDWYLEHEAISSESGGTYEAHHPSIGLNEDGSIELRTQVTEERKCSDPDAKEHGWCRVLESGKKMRSSM